jgi:capsular polysaccharide biosynthesis protein
VYGRSYVGEDPAYYLPKRRPVLRKSGHYFSLVGKWGIQAQGNYYHWLHDTVERLFGVIPLLPVDTRYIVPANLTPLQIETLRLVGVKEDQLADFSGEEVWELETLHFAPPTSNSGSHRRDADEWLRDKILDGCGIAPTPAKRRIFISRRQAPNRRLVNEAEVEDYLHRCGFETWVPERLPICEQAKVFSQAEIVVSTHGAGLTNMLFAPRGLVVVDMIQPDMLPMAYVFWAMAEELGHQYWYFVAEAVPQPASRPDTIVPLEKLMATFDRLGYSPEASERPADAGDTVVLPDAADDTVVLPDDVGPNERSRPSRQARD